MFPDNPTKDDYKQDCIDAIKAIGDFVIEPKIDFLNKLSKKELSNLSIWLDDINSRFRANK